MRSIALASVVLVGCAVHEVRHPQDCALYGVRDTGDSRLVMEAEELPQAQLDIECSGVDRPEGYVYSGCMRHNPDGSVRIYWRKGDLYAREHEYAHALCGHQHTDEYIAAMAAGHPCPYCPDIIGE